MLPCQAGLSIANGHRDVKAHPYNIESKDSW